MNTIEKAILVSIQPYWVFLIIANKMGWNIGKEKTIEVRKNRPKEESWNKVAKIYCSKDKKSFNKIPKEYQSFMETLLGKVIGEFVCDGITSGFLITPWGDYIQKQSCLTYKEIYDYCKNKPLYYWHISDLVIYDKPKELYEFRTLCKEQYKEKPKCRECGYFHSEGNESIGFFESCCFDGVIPLTRPPQNWCYVGTP